MPAVGFGFGDVVIAELLADHGLLPALPRGIDDVVCALGEAQRPAAIRIAERLRAGGAPSSSCSAICARSACSPTPTRRAPLRSG